MQFRITQILGEEKNNFENLTRSFFQYVHIEQPIV